MTTEFSEIARCATWLGPNQPGINEDLGLPRYDPSVCPDGTTPEHARQTLCDPGGERRSARAGQQQTETASDLSSSSPGSASAPDGPAPGDPLPELPDLSGPGDLGDVTDEVLGLPDEALQDLGLGLPGRGGTLGSSRATKDLLDFLLGP
jgi:hypothetical protein